MRKNIEWSFIFLGVTSPIWMPLLGGHLFALYGDFYGKAKISTVELTNFTIAIIAFLVGNISVGFLLKGFERLIGLLSYSVAALLVLFITGWSALLIAGYAS